MSTITVAQARQEFYQRKKDISDVDAIPDTFLRWCNYVNRYAYKLFTNIFPESYIKNQTYNLVNSLATYDLPTDFQDVGPAGTGPYLVGQNNIPTDTRLPTTNYASTKTGYYMSATQLIFTPVPNQPVTYIFRYIPLLNDLSEELSEFIIPQRFSQYLMDALDTCYNIWDEDNNAEIFNDTRFMNSLNQLVELIKPDSNAYGLPDVGLDFYP